MGIRKDVYIIFLSLAIAYTVFLGFTILRIRSLFRFLPQWKYAKLIYYILLVQILSRVLSFWYMCIYSEQIQLHNSIFSFILLSMPDSLLICSLILLLWVLITGNLYTRSASDENHIPIGNFSYLYRAGNATLKVLAVWVLSQGVLYGFLALEILTRKVIVAQQCVWCVSASIVTIIFILYLQIKCSGIPFESPRASKQMKRVTFVSLMWSIGRLVHTILYIVRESELNNPDSLKEISDNTIPLIITLIDLIISELLCYYIVLTNLFIKVFLPQKVHSTSIPLMTRPRKDSYVLEMQDSQNHDLIIHKEISNQRGKLGILYLGQLENNSVAIRRINLSRINSYVLEKLQQDMNELRSISNPYLLTNIKLIVKQSNIDLVMPYISGGSLFAAIHDTKAKLTLADKLKIGKEIALCLKLIHAQNRVHGHLSSHNILIELNSIYVVDIGFGHLKKYAGIVSGYCNKNAWSSPEILKESGNIAIRPTVYDDAYSFGILLWEIISEQEPFPAYSLKKLKQMVGDQGYRPALNGFYAQGIEELIKSCWNSDPTTRPTFALIFSTLSKICDDT
jgi:Protein tyrosine and serine/threonine kinase